MGLRPSEHRGLEALEAEYELRLRDALTRCAAGEWGLFGVNDDLPGMARYRSKMADELLELGEEIDGLRARGGLGVYAPHARFVAERAARGANLPGEPKRAAVFLADLADMAG